MALALLAACSEQAPPEAPQTAAALPAAMQGQAPTAPKQAAPQQADLAAAEAAAPAASDPCDLSGYDMSQMTAELHERLVEACSRSKQ